MKADTKLNKDTLKAVCQEALSEAFVNAFEIARQDIASRFDIEMPGYEDASISIEDRHDIGYVWATRSLHSIVSDLIDRLDPNDADPSWCDSVISDLERQAKRLRKHADKIRRKRK